MEVQVIYHKVWLCSTIIQQVLRYKILLKKESSPGSPEVVGGLGNALLAFYKGTSVLLLVVLSKGFGFLLLGKVLWGGVVVKRRGGVIGGNL